MMAEFNFASYYNVSETTYYNVSKLQETAPKSILHTLKSTETFCNVKFL